jgi:hypothetical protein
MSPSIYNRPAQFLPVLSIGPQSGQRMKQGSNLLSSKSYLAQARLEERDGMAQAMAVYFQWWRFLSCAIVRSTTEEIDK